MKTLILIAAILATPAKMTRVAHGDIVFPFVPMIAPHFCTQVRWIADSKIRQVDFIKADTYEAPPKGIFFVRWIKDGKINFRECNLNDEALMMVPEVKMWWEVWR